MVVVNMFILLNQARLLQLLGQCGHLLARRREVPARLVSDVHTLVQVLPGYVLDGGEQHQQHRRHAHHDRSQVNAAAWISVTCATASQVRFCLIRS